MKPTRKMIDALRRTAERVSGEDGGFNWASCHECTCGILVQELTGMSAVGVKNLVVNDSYIGTWTSRSAIDHEFRRPSQVVENLCEKYGFEPIDFHRLEYLKYPSDGIFSHPDDVTKWLYAEADRLEVQLVTLQKEKEKVNVQTQQVQLR